MKKSFESSSGVIVTHYLGLNSSELTDLRSQVRAIGSRFCVAKNSLAKLAATSTDYESLNDFNKTYKAKLPKITKITFFNTF